MVNKLCTGRRSEAGFTLVELAVVMIIIGLLIGGVLKGQQLIANAQVASTVAQVKGFDAATTTFRDMYASLPGDIVNPGGRLPNCTGAPCNTAGNGDSRVNGDFSNAPAGEEISFWAHLNSADLISGVDPSLNAVWGGQFPAGRIGGGFHVAYFVGGATLPSPSGQVGANIRAGHYLALHNVPNGGVDAIGFLDANQAFRIDSKLDDGVPGSGSVLAAGAAAGANGCAANATTYNEDFAAATCNLYLRFQN